VVIISGSGRGWGAREFCSPRRFYDGDRAKVPCVQASSPTFGPLVEAAWLADHASDVVVCDVRWYLDGRSGRSPPGADR
jgi:hypothetical protein